MANSGRRSAAPVRKAIAAVLGTIATFIVLFGAGMSSWAIVALGAALLVLAISLALVNVARRGARAWVAGTAHVVSASEPPASSKFGRCELQLVVDAPGMPAAAVKVRDPRVPVAKWPDAGTTLPVLVAVDDMRHVRIQWDEVMTHNEAATVLGEVPPAYGDGSADFAADDILVQESSPPWSARERNWASADAEPATTEFGDQLDGLRSEAPPDLVQPEPFRPEPVVVRESAAGGPIVLEGTVVETGSSTTVPLPRRGSRPRPSPRPRRPADDGAPARAADPAPHPTDAAPQPTDAAHDAGRAPGGPAAAAAARPDAAGPPARPAGTAVADPPVTTGADVPPAASTAADTPAAPAAASATAAPDPGRPAPRTSTHDDLDDLITAYPSARTGTTGSIHGVGITVLVTELDRSVDFYRHMLGFHQIDGGPGNAVLASGDTRLVLREVSDATPIHRRPVHLNLEVGDVQGAYRDLVGKGVVFTTEPAPIDRGGKLELWEATFSDPDGNDIALTQWRAVS